MKIYGAGGVLNTGVRPREWKDFRHVPGTGGPTEAWYTAAVTGIATGSGAVMSANVLYVLPFMSPARGGSIDAFRFEVTTAAVGNAKVGVYANEHPNRIFPGKLLLEGNSLDTSSTGILTDSINLKMDQESLYWLAWFKSSASVGIKHFSNPVALESIIGVDGAAATTAITVGYTVAATYGSMPDPFPTSSVSRLLASSSTIPIVWMRYSS